jgi:hypothetical protein
MPKILITADLHLSENPRDEYRHQFMHGLVGIVKRRKPDALLILGDLTQEKDRHSSVLVNSVVNHLDLLADECPVGVLMGNHDYANESFPFFAFLGRIPNVTWIDRVMDGARLPNGLARVLGNALFLPHTRSYQEDWAEAIPAFGSFKWIFAHNTFNGANVGFGRELEGIPLDIFPRKARVVSGDIHVPQTFGPITYVGAPYTVNYGDDYKPRLLAIEGGDAHSVSVASWPQKRLITINDVADLDALSETLNAGDLCKVRASIDDMGTWHSTRKAIEKWGADIGVIVQRMEPVIVAKSIKRRVRIKESDQHSDRDVLEQFGRRHDVDDKTMKLGVELLELSGDK